MKKRLIGAILLLSILIISRIISPKVFALVMLGASIIAFYEFVNIKHKNNIFIVYLIGIISLILIVLNNIFFHIKDIVTYIIPILSLMIMLVLYNDKDRYNINDALSIMAIIFIIGISFNTIALTSNINIFKCIYIFVMAFITDTYCYIGGMLIGRHKLTSISPKKTIEGTIIGTIMGVIIGTFYYVIFINDMSLIAIIFVSLLLSILSQIGDLFFSSIKRYFDIKDYSNLIPGHGGILDRFDSVIFVALGLMLIINL